MRSSGTVSHGFGTQRMTPLGAATLPGDNRANRQIPSLSSVSSENLSATQVSVEENALGVRRPGSKFQLCHFS